MTIQTKFLQTNNLIPTQILLQTKTLPPKTKSLKLHTIFVFGFVNIISLIKQLTVVSQIINFS